MFVHFISFRFFRRARIFCSVRQTERPAGFCLDQLQSVWVWGWAPRHPHRPPPERAKCRHFIIPPYLLMALLCDLISTVELVITFVEIRCLFCANGRTASYCSSLVAVLLLLLFLLLFLVPVGCGSDGRTNWTSLRRKFESHRDELIWGTEKITL